MSSPMTPIVRHVYWAGKGFTHRGVWLWTGRRNVRVIPLNRPREWSGGPEDRR